jgi:hypothetical protein
MRKTMDEPKPKERATERAKVIWEAVSAVLAALLILQTLWLSRSQAFTQNEIDATEAQRFMVEFYFPAVLHDPADALDRWGTPEFIAAKKASGVDHYVSWYRATRALEHVDVLRHGEEPYMFDVSFDRILKNSGVKSGPKRVVYGIECANKLESHIPWRHCKAENLRINYNARISHV